jgi:hypothetical protein
MLNLSTNSDLEPFGTIRAMLPHTHTSVRAKTFENLDLSFFRFVCHFVSPPVLGSSLPLN